MAGQVAKGRKLCALVLPLPFVPIEPVRNRAIKQRVVGLRTAGPLECLPPTSPQQSRVRHDGLRQFLEKLF